MDKGYENEKFEKLGIKVSVATRFRKFCKKMSKSQSMTLLLMIEFFEENEISPLEKLGPSMKTLEKKLTVLINKRSSGQIAIIKNIEKTSSKPTLGILQALIAGAETPNEKLLLEKNDPALEEELRFRESLKGDVED